MTHDIDLQLPSDSAKTLPVRRKESSLAVVSFVFGIIGLFLFGSIIAIICGHIARSEIKRNPSSMSGDGYAFAGLIMGYIGLVLFALVIVFYLALVGWMLNQ